LPTHQNNLEAAPFNFPPPLECVPSHPPFSPEKDETCIFEIDRLKEVASHYKIDA